MNKKLLSEKRIMKVLICVGLIISFSIPIIGCNNSNSTKKVSQNSSISITITPIQKVTSSPTKEEKPTNSPITPTLIQTPTITNSLNKEETQSDDNIIVYYVEGSNVYHLSKSDSTLRKSKNILEMTLKEAKEKGMHQSNSKADQ